MLAEVHELRLPYLINVRAVTAPACRRRVASPLRRVPAPCPASPCGRESPRARRASADHVACLRAPSAPSATPPRARARPPHPFAQESACECQTLESRKAQTRTTMILMPLEARLMQGTSLGKQMG
jgi:hypothetical protein